MKLRRLSIFIFVVLAPVVVGAALPAELYWKSLLPNTTMPKAVKDLSRAENMKKVIYVDQKVPLVLQPHATPMTGQLLDDSKSTLHRQWLPTTSTADQLNDDPIPSWSLSTSLLADQLQDDPCLSWSLCATLAADQLHNDPSLAWTLSTTPTADQLNDDPSPSWSFSTTLTADQLHNNPSVAWTLSTTPTVDQLRNDPSLAWTLSTTSRADQQRHATLATAQPHDDSLKVLFLFEKDLYPRKKLEMLFTKSPYSTALIPCEVANTIAFSLEMVPKTLNIFSIAPESKEAKLLKHTIFNCQTTSVIKTEQKQCVTSLESMVDYITSKFGKNVEAYSTEVEKETQLQNYTIAPGVKKISDELMACHQSHYPHVVFSCHQLGASRAYFVPLEGSDGTRVKAIAVCHLHTSNWDPNLFAFRVLKIKPGTVPVCHFSTADTIIWTPKNTT